MTRWTRDRVAPGERKWEEFYRNRFQHDKRVRTTHGVNCTGGCSWEVFVKDFLRSGVRILRSSPSWSALGARLPVSPGGGECRPFIARIHLLHNG